MRPSDADLAGTIGISDECWAAVVAEAEAVDAEFAAAGDGQEPEQLLDGDQAGETMDGEQVRFRLASSPRTESDRRAHEAAFLAHSIICGGRRRAPRPRQRRATASRRQGSRRSSRSRAPASGDPDPGGEPEPPSRRLSRDLGAPATEATLDAEIEQLLDALGPATTERLLGEQELFDRLEAELAGGAQ